MLAASSSTRFTSVSAQDLLTPRMAALLERIPRANRPGFETMSPPDARVAYTAAAEVLEPPRAPLARVEEITLPGADGATLPARLYAPSDDALPVLLYLHGGGFTIGNLETHDSLCRQLALRSGAAVVALDYRLAPEHRFPTAVDDCWAALQALARPDTAARLRPGHHAPGRRRRQRRRHAGGRVRAAGARRRPRAGAAGADHAGHDRARRHAVARALRARLPAGEAAVDWFFDNYIDAAERTDWRFAPALAPDHEGVAPACMVMAECDALVDEAVAYGDILRAAGVAVDLELWRGVTHDFIKMGRMLPEAAQAQQAIADALKKAFE